jgi:hypothetical protein
MSDPNVKIGPLKREDLTREVFTFRADLPGWAAAGGPPTG